MDPIAYCTLKAEQSGSNFLASFRFLPPAKREALTVVYAFCREVDDVVDECSDAATAQTTLNWWRSDLHRAFAGQMPEHPVHQALVAVAAAFRLSKSEFASIIDGMEMDLHLARYADFAALKNYCQHVAGDVGRLIARILGFQNPQTLAYADALGLALQLTNIIRDVGEDARRGRIYLPTEELQRFDCSAHRILSGEGGAEFTALMQFQIERAKAAYRDAVALLPAEDKKSQKIGLVMGAIYYALLREIERDGAGKVLRYKIALPGPRKKRIALKTWLLGFHP